MPLNSIQFQGNLTRDPESQFLPSGAHVAKFALANNERWTDKNGEIHETVTFVECEAWERTADFVVQWCHKGDQRIVEGKLQLDRWQDKDGNDRQKLKIRVLRVHFSGSRQDSAQQPVPAPQTQPVPARAPAAPPAPAPAPSPPQESGVPEVDISDELPPYSTQTDVNDLPF